MYHFSNAVDKKARASTYSTSSRSVFTDPQCYRPRHYHPGLGRFVQRDPLGYSDGPNLSAYALANPANLVDPTGLEVLDGWGAWDTKDWINISEDWRTSGMNEDGQFFGDDAATRPHTIAAYKEPFLLAFYFHVQSSYEQGRKDDGTFHSHRLGFFPNSGVYIYNAIEVAIINTNDVIAKIESNKNSTIDPSGRVRVPGFNDGVNENVFELMTGIPYRGPYVNDPTGKSVLEKYPNYDTKKWLEFMKENNRLRTGNVWNWMIIYFEPCFENDVLISYKLNVFVNGLEKTHSVDTKMVNPTKKKMALSEIKDYRVFLQSHHGSHIFFKGMMIRTGKDIPDRFK